DLTDVELDVENLGRVHVENDRFLPEGIEPRLPHFEIVVSGREVDESIEAVGVRLAGGHDSGIRVRNLDCGAADYGSAFMRDSPTNSRGYFGVGPKAQTQDNHDSGNGKAADGFQNPMELHSKRPPVASSSNSLHVPSRASANQLFLFLNYYKSGFISVNAQRVKLNFCVLAHAHYGHPVGSLRREEVCSSRRSKSQLGNISEQCYACVK